MDFYVFSYKYLVGTNYICNLTIYALSGVDECNMYDVWSLNLNSNYFVINLNLLAYILSVYEWQIL